MTYNIYLHPTRLRDTSTLEMSRRDICYVRSVFRAMRYERNHITELIVGSIIFYT